MTKQITALMEQIAKAVGNCKVHSNTGRIITVIAPDMSHATTVAAMLQNIGVTSRIFAGHFTPHHYVMVHYG